MYDVRWLMLFVWSQTSGVRYLMSDIGFHFYTRVFSCTKIEISRVGDFVRSYYQPLEFFLSFDYILFQSFLPLTLPSFTPIGLELGGWVLSYINDISMPVPTHRESESEGISIMGATWRGRVLKCLQSKTQRQWCSCQGSEKSQGNQVTAYRGKSPKVVLLMILRGYSISQLQKVENIVLVLRSGICGFHHMGKINLTCYQVFQGIEILLIINMVVSIVHYSTQNRPEV